MPDFELRPTSKIWIAEDKIKWRLKQWECLSVERWRRAPVVDDFIADMWPLTPDIETRLEVKVRSSKKADDGPSGSMITDTREPLARRNNSSRRHFNFDHWTSGMKHEIKDLPNLGQFMSKKLAEIGITNEDELRKIGAVQAYVRLKFLFGREITLNALWAMDATLSGIDWRLLSEERKQELLAQLPKLGR